MCACHVMIKRVKGRGYVLGSTLEGLTKTTDVAATRRERRQDCRDGRSHSRP